MLIAGLGGFFGTCARFIINKLFVSFWDQSFPLATFIINISGCFIFGVIAGLLQKIGILNPNINAFLIVGFCGGFTTFSTFSFEAFSLLSSGEIYTSIFYVIISIIAGVLATWFGLTLSS